MAEQTHRVERDSMGEVKVPAHALYGAQTQRAVDNFPISDLRFPRTFVRALGLIKGAAAAANEDLGLMEPCHGRRPSRKRRTRWPVGMHDDHFVLDIFQTGSGTSTNMNANEVLASLATKYLGSKVHQNDHVNMSQSSNDVIPTAIHVAPTWRSPRTCSRPCATCTQTLVDKGGRGRSCGDDRPHAPDGRHAGAHGADRRRLGQPDRARHRAHRGVAAAAGRAGAGRHGRRHGHQRAPGVRQAALPPSWPR